MQAAFACEEGTMSDPATLAEIAAHNRIFPLRLSPIELLMIADDQVAPESVLRSTPRPCVAASQTAGCVGDTAIEAPLTADAAHLRWPPGWNSGGTTISQREDCLFATPRG